MLWHFRGTPAYLKAQGDRMGLDPILIDQARHSREIHYLSTILGQLHERYRSAIKGTLSEVAGLPPRDLAPIKASLEQGVRVRDKLHALAAASDDMLDEAYAAFGLTPPDRSTRVVCDYDSTEPTPAPSENGHESPLSAATLPRK